MQLPWRLNRTPIRIGVVAVAAVLGVAGAAYAVLPGPATATLASSAKFASDLVAVHSEKCLTLPDRPDGRGTLRQHPCGDRERQQFTFTERGEFYQISGAATGACVDVRRGWRNEGAPVIAWSDCHGGRNQQFTLKPVDEPANSYMIVARHSGLCLDVAGGSQDDRASIVQWECDDPTTAGNQIWRIDGSAGPADEVRTGPARYGPASPEPSPSDEPDTIPSPAGSGAGPGDAPQARANPDWGRALPPAGAPRSRAYQMILGDDKRGYHPRSGECSRDVHARYWTYGPDGKVYPTWHPPRHSSGCAFGHEHGDDPRNSKLFAKVGWPAFGYVNEQLAPSAPASQRDEDHVGHKVQVGNDRKVIEGDDGRAREAPDGRVSMICDSLIKFHQGTHSPDAFTNNLHELLYNVRCTYQDDGHVIETQLSLLPPIGPPGGFTPTRDCASPNEHRHVGPASPADSPDTRFDGRLIPDEHCAASVLAGDHDLFAMHETWFANVFAFQRSGGLRNLQVFGYFLVLDPSRFFDPGQPDNLGRHVDLCYDGAPGFQCDQLRRATQRNGGERISWDDPRSPFKGANRLFAPGILVVQNEGPSTLYSDPFGTRFSTEPFPGSVKQYLAGNRASDRSQGFIRGTFTNYAADPADGVHAPN